jgi:hypothetical protein
MTEITKDTLINDTVELTVSEVDSAMKRNGLDGIKPREAIIIGMVEKILFEVLSTGTDTAVSSIMKHLHTNLHETCWREL